MPGARIDGNERITLRTVEEEDIPFVQRATTTPEIRYPMGKPLKNRAEVKAHHEEDDADQFLVCLDEDDAGPGTPKEEAVRRIGCVSVEDAAWKRPELVYWLVPEEHGNGYGKAAVSLVVNYNFRTYDTPAIGAGAFEFNDASRGLLESLGFTEEGRRRKFMFIDGEHRDIVQYGLLREEWRNEDRT